MTDMITSMKEVDQIQARHNSETRPDIYNSEAHQDRAYLLKCIAELMVYTEAVAEIVDEDTFQRIEEEFVLWKSVRQGDD